MQEKMWGIESSNYEALAQELEQMESITDIFNKIWLPWDYSFRISLSEFLHRTMVLRFWYEWRSDYHWTPKWNDKLKQFIIDNIERIVYNKGLIKSLVEKAKEMPVAPEEGLTKFAKIFWREYPIPEKDTSIPYKIKKLFDVQGAKVLDNEILIEEIEKAKWKAREQMAKLFVDKITDDILSDITKYDIDWEFQEDFMWWVDYDLSEWSSFDNSVITSENMKKLEGFWYTRRAIVDILNYKLSRERVKFSIPEYLN